jgi:16S rRNA processing protein RimM
VREAACGAEEAPNAVRFLAIARVLRPQGRKGEVAAEILTDFPVRFEALRSVFLERQGHVPELIEVEAAWRHKGRIVLKFAGINSIDDASRLRGLPVLIAWERRVALPAHQYYVCELEGCRVFLARQGTGVGTVTEVEPTGGVDVLHVARENGTEVLIPLAQEICTQIDLASRIIVIDPPEDLLELNE